MSDRNCEDVPLPDGGVVLPTQAAAPDIANQVGGLPPADSRRLPRRGEWPCQTERPQYVPPRLKAALYRLLRDHVRPGDMEQVAIDVAPHTINSTFTNPHLEAYAESLAAYLLWEPETETGLA